VNKKRGLGRGLDALLGIGAEKPTPDESQGDTLRLLPVDLIQRGRYQPRLTIRPEALQELADSIKAQGLIQPVLVRALGEGGRYELIAGERRWRAAQLAGLTELPAIVRVVTDRTVMSLAIIENIQREQLSPLEEAQALQRLLTEFGMTHQEVAAAIGRSRAAVSNLLRLLDLGVDARRLLEEGALEMGHARALLATKGAEQTRLAKLVAERGLSVRATERLVQAEGRAKDPKAEPDPNIAALSARIAAQLGLFVDLRAQRRGGELRIRWEDPEQEAALFQRLGVSLDDDES
jgi:ParB family chromosome partitioning protein